MVTREEIVQALNEVIDPEIGLSLVDINLIKEILINGDKVKVKMKLTDSLRLFADDFVADVNERVESLPSVKEAQVELVF